MPPLTRRRFLVTAASAFGASAVVGCRGSSAAPVGPASAAVRQVEARRRNPGAAVRNVTLTAGLVDLELGGRRVQTWAYEGKVPGPEVRLRAGEVLRARLANRLPDPTTIHWHGVALRNDMDGVPDVTQEPVAAGSDFTYEFTAPHPGTFFFHPHVGLQLDRGLYAPLIVEDPAEPGAYDRELVIVVDDWTDGVGEAPEAILERLRREAAAGMGMDPGMGGTAGTGATSTTGGMGGSAGTTGGMGGSAGTTGGMGGMVGGPGSALGGDAGDVAYSLYLLNGRPPEAPAAFQARPGERVRLRVINAGADTAFRLAVGGHRMQITHSDGFPVEPVTADAVLLGMGERVDAVVTVGDGVFPVVARAEGKTGGAFAVLRSGAGTAPTPAMAPPELDRMLVTGTDLRSAAAVTLPARKPDRTHDVVLGVDEGRYRWTINGRTFDDPRLLDVEEGERVRLRFDNRTPMFHPMHLHGHTFQVTGERSPGPRKDTVVVRPKERVTVDFDTDNPGQWVVHCHNIYHQEAGMMTTLSYVQ